MIVGIFDIQQCALQCESKKSPPPLRPMVFWHFFTNGWEF